MLAIGTKPSGLHCSYWWCLDDSDSLHNLLLVRLGSWAVEVADDGGHTGLVTHGGSQVHWLLWVILWEAAQKVSVSILFPRRPGIANPSPLDLSAVSSGTLSWKEGQRPMARGFELPVRHVGDVLSLLS